MFGPRQCIAARSLVGFSQADLARAAEVSVVTVESFEAATRDTRLSVVRAILEAFQREGVEFASPTNRHVGGILIVRDSRADMADRRVKDTVDPALDPPD